MDDEEDATLQQLQGHSITYRIAMGAAGGAQSAHRLCGPVQTIPAWEEDDCGTGQLGKVGGFSLHAGVAVNTPDRKKLERICRYYFSPSAIGGAIGADRSGYGQLCLENSLSGWDDWAAIRHVVFEPLDFMAKLAALVPKLEPNLTGPPRTISWSTGPEQSVPRERDAAQCSPGRACHR